MSFNWPVIVWRGIHVRPPRVSRVEVVRWGCDFCPRRTRGAGRRPTACRRSASGSRWPVAVPPPGDADPRSRSARYNNAINGEFFDLFALLLPIYAGRYRQLSTTAYYTPKTVCGRKGPSSPIIRHYIMQISDGKEVDIARRSDQ